MLRTQAYQLPHTERALPNIHTFVFVPLMCECSWWCVTAQQDG